MTDATRSRAGDHFTVADSVDALLTVLRAPPALTPWAVTQELETLVRLPAVDPPRPRSDDDRILEVR